MQQKKFAAWIYLIKYIYEGRLKSIGTFNEFEWGLFLNTDFLAVDRGFRIHRLRGKIPPQRGYQMTVGGDP